MMKTAALILLLWGFLWVPSLVFGQEASFPPLSGGKPVTLKFVSEVSAFAPGEPFKVAMEMDHGEGWHTYWENSGGVQFSPEIVWQLPDGFSAGKVEWPTPEKGVLQGSIAYYYGGKNYLFVEITPSADAKQGAEVELKADVEWQYCNEEVCSVGGEAVSLNLSVASEAVPNEANAKAFSEFRETQMPVPLSNWDLEVVKTAKGKVIAIKPKAGANPDAKTFYFFSSDSQIDGQKKQNVTRDGDWFLISVSNHDESGAKAKTLPGVLYSPEGLLAGGKINAMQIDPPVLEKSQRVDAVVKSEEAPEKGLLGLLLFAFLGGFILNLMPCVFPVIGIKIMGFVNQAGEDRKKIVMHGVIFAVGVLASFMVLATVFYVLREQGAGVGWGFQLQEPWFIFVLMLVMFVFAMNMAGIFEIGTSVMNVGSGLQHKSGLLGTFFSGVLATVVATPCSAPFLGTALGAVLTLTAVPFFLVFIAIALGLSLPYLVLSAFPDLVKKLPKPGPWMETFKQLMSFLLFGTAGYLIWVYGGLVSELKHLTAIIGLTVIATGLWAYGRWGNVLKPKKTRLISYGVAAVLLLTGFILGKPESKANDLEWQTWSPGLKEQLIEDGRPVYIDFTARWCATCQTNKSAYNSDKIREVIKNKDVALLKADWTKRGPVIQEAIASYGRNAIPVNILYVPGNEKAVVLPELLTADVVMKYLNEIPD